MTDLINELIHPKYRLPFDQKAFDLVIRYCLYKKFNGFPFGCFVHSTEHTPKAQGNKIQRARGELHEFDAGYILK